MLTEIQIELMGVCNATCCYCTWQKRTTGKQAMDTTLAHRLLDEAHAINPKMRVRYHGLGEALIHKDILDIVAHGERLGLDHSVSTNCFNLHGELAEKLSQVPGLHVILAVPWVMPEHFVDRCVQNAANYLDCGFANRQVHVQMVCHTDARKYYDRFIQEFLPLVTRHANAYLHLKQPVTWPNDTPNPGFIFTELMGNTKVLLDIRETPLSIGAGCTMPDRFLMIQADGTCVPCCVGMDDWGLGTIHNRGLKDVWASAEMVRIREDWKQASDRIPCGHCKKRTDCLQQTIENPRRRSSDDIG